MADAVPYDISRAGAHLAAVSAFVLARLRADELDADRAVEGESAAALAERQALVRGLRAKRAAVDMCVAALARPELAAEIRIFAGRLVLGYARPYRDHPDAPELRA